MRSPAPLLAGSLTASQLNFGAEWCFIYATGCVKISILLFYGRLASGTFTQGFLWATRLGILYNICYVLAFSFVLIFLCQPT